MNLLQRQLEDPVRRLRIRRWFHAGLGVVAAAEIVLPRVFESDHAPHFWFEMLPAWGSLYGLVSCLLIVVVSKLLGKIWLMRREDYYDS